MFKDNRGITLIEIVVTIAILGIVIVPIYTMFLAGLKTNAKSTKLMTATDLAQEYMEDIKCSNSVIVGKQTIQKDGYTIDINIQPTEYSFGSNENTSVSYDMKIIVDKNDKNNVSVNNEDVYISSEEAVFDISCDETSLQLNLYDNDMKKKTEVVSKEPNKAGHISVEAYENMNFVISAKNNSNKDFKIDLYQSKDAVSEYELKYTSNNIIFKPKVSIDDYNYDKDFRLYLVTIDIKRLDPKTNTYTVLDSIKSYKSFFE
ncbi:type IV pilus modification PilV family protein [Abyssisolibacter fermentans]|uniref:type IV pilus modification PilV family protein n=1 Tax=Abyssisolibacter fermentans TaxID=1766203 RepID=UPI00082CA8CA|nr:prepilin-type N-terminal cleavage/methylation domain-containing protein [Abyssisolibacter fermentans]